MHNAVEVTEQVVLLGVVVMVVLAVRTVLVGIILPVCTDNPSLTLGIVCFYVVRVKDDLVGESSEDLGQTELCRARYK